MRKDTSTLIFSIIVFISGIAGLSYELLWMKSIKGYFGCEIFSITMVITLYFIGLGSGGFIANKFLKRNIAPFHIYMAIEFLIGIFGLLFPILIPACQKLYLTSTTMVPEPSWIILKALYISVLLIIPTTLIGMTLPVIAAIGVNKPESFTRKFSLFYGINTFGAVIGSLICGIILIPKIGLNWTGRTIVLCNFVVVFLCWIFQSKFTKSSQSVVFKSQKWNQALFPCLVAFFMGFLALTYEIVWFRIFNFYFLTTTISLAILLCIFLVGLALGSLILSFWKREISVAQLGILEISKAIIMIAAFFVIRYIFFKNWLSIAASFKQNDALQSLVNYYILFGVIAFLVPGILMGLTFPLIERVWPSAKAGTGHVVGVVTAWNTWGGAVGAALAGLIFISLIGTTGTLLISISISFILGSIILIYTRKYILAIVPLFIAICVIAFLPREMNWKRTDKNLDNYLFYKEGKMCSVAVIKNNYGDLSLFLDNTYVLGGTSMDAVRVHIHQGALPNLLKFGNHKKVLNIGEGTGITSRSCADDKNITQFDVVEIIPEVVEALPFFSNYNNNFWRNNKVKTYKSDGREFMAFSKTKYDMIMGDIYSPQVAGNGNLFSVEHFMNIKNHLSDSGLYCQWIQLSQFSPETFKILINTFIHVFGNGSLWVANNNIRQPCVGLVYNNGKFWNTDNIKQGLNQYSDSLKKILHWEQPEDIAMAFVSDRLELFAETETRVNSINYPIIEEIAARTINETCSLGWLINHRHWPNEWTSWNSAHSAWEMYWSVMQSMVAVIQTKQIDENYFNVITHIDSLPNYSILNLYKAYMINDLTEEILLKQNIVGDPKEQYAFIEKFYLKAVELDPYNYNYRSNIISLYIAQGEKDKIKPAFTELWNIIPNHLKSEPFYQNLKNQFQN